MDETDDKSTLNARQRKFIEEYIVDDNAVQAYFRAYGRTTGDGTPRSYHGAGASASELLKNPKIKEEIKAARLELARRTKISANRVVQEIAALAMSDQGDLFDEQADSGMPTPKPWSQVSPAARRAIQSVKIKKRVIQNKNNPDDVIEFIEEVEYKLHAKSSELDKLCKKLGLFEKEDKTVTDEKTIVELPAKVPLPAEEPLPGIPAFEGDASEPGTDEPLPPVAESGA